MPKIKTKTIRLISQLLIIIRTRRKTIFLDIVKVIYSFKY